MENYLTMTNLFFPLLASLGVLIGIVWNITGKRLDELERNNETCPIHRMDADLAEMKNDIKWIKGYLFNDNLKK